MVDKPTPTDWRRLLAFSREWDDIRPHFFMRCQDRADAEDDPGMKHEILRLARKLKEVECVDEPRVTLSCSLPRDLLFWYIVFLHVMGKVQFILCLVYKVN